MSDPGTSRPRIPAIDWIKATAIVAVVFTHSGVAPWSPLFGPWDTALRRSWVSFHVPSFLLVAGFLYHRVTPLGARDMGVRLTRVLVPYLIASLFAFAAGFSRAEGLDGMAVALLTGSAIGIYYFVFALALCLLLLWPLSRVPDRFSLVCVALAFSYVLVLRYQPGARLLWGPFWMIRDPLANFYFGFFALGWLAAGALPQLAAFQRRHPAVVWLLCAIGIALWVMTRIQLPLSPAAYASTRILYTLAVVTAISIATAGRHLPTVVAFLSEASLAIYLTHRFFQEPLLAITLEWNAPIRILFLVALGLAAPSALILLSRRILGLRWSRTLIGA